MQTFSTMRWNGRQTKRVLLECSVGRELSTKKLNKHWLLDSLLSSTELLWVSWNFRFTLGCPPLFLILQSHLLEEIELPFSHVWENFLPEVFVYTVIGEFNYPSFCILQDVLLADFWRNKMHVKMVLKCSRQVENSSVAVSYTHLTLPTNREV